MTHFVELFTSERDSIMAGLRLLQLLNEGRVSLVAQAEPERSEGGELGAIRAIAADNGNSLDNDRLENLIEELNNS